MTEKRTRGALCSFKYKQGLQGRKRQGHQIGGERDERGAIVSSASRGSREENVRGAKLSEKRTRGAPCSFKCKLLKEENLRGATLKEKRTRGAPCSFKCKQGLQGRKR